MSFEANHTIPLAIQEQAFAVFGGKSHWIVYIPSLLIRLETTCVFVLLVERVVNVGVPFILAKLVDILEGRSPWSVWGCLVGYVGLRFLQGSGGLAAIRDVSLV